MGEPPRPRPPGPGAPPITVPPSMAAKESILQRAQQVAKAHVGVDAEEEKKISSDWRDFFDEQRQVHVPSRRCTFNVYLAGPKKQPDDGCRTPVIYCVHGGGYTGLSFALIAEELRETCQVVAFDMRYHGGTECQDGESEPDFARDTLTEDVLALWHAMFEQNAPPTVLVGHSVGGAIAVWAALAEGPNAISELEGLVVIDVVEGTAVAALPMMTTILNKRPDSFASPQGAIEWVLDQNMCKSRRAAAISVPAQLREQDGRFVWRTPLLKSEPAWLGWYEGLSEAFLRVAVPKVLVLAGADRLDKSLTIAQMQGKFQMVLVPAAGHAVHEDDAERMIDTIEMFVKRFRIGQPPLAFLTAGRSGAPRVLPQAAGPLHQ